MSLFGELKRRNVIRMAGLYLVGAWLIVQVASTVFPAFELPGWALRGVILLMAIGFIPALVVSWIFELTPDGLKRDSEVPASESIAPQTARRMDRMIIIVLLVALAYFAVDKFFLAPMHAGNGSASAPAAKAAQPGGGTAPGTAAIHPKSIAVLAFADMSANKDSEYFSDGVAEEILNALAKVDDMKVAGRTSSFYFKGRNEPLSVIGSTLGVAHVLEGSVRKQGERLRITAKLLRVSDGVEMWSETFDGTDADIFALQESIARRVASQLQVALDAGQQDQLVRAGTRNPEAYALYLQASATFNRRDSARNAEAMAQLEQATRLDPGFARAYARLAALFSVALNAETVDYDEAIAAAEKFALRASHIDPTLAEPHAVLGQIFRYLRKPREAAAAYARAKALEPDDVTTNFWWAITQIQSGYRRQGIATLDRTLQLDPLLPNALFWRAREHIADGELDQADRLLRRAAESGHSFVGVAQWQVEKARGNREAAISALATSLEYFSRAFPAGTTAVFARACLGDAEAKTRALALIDAHLASKPAHVGGVAAYVLVHAGEPARALALIQDRSTTNDALVMGEIFSSTLAETRRSPGFPEFVRRMGLAAFWDEAGPPDQCRKDAKGDYHCD